MPPVSSSSSLTVAAAAIAAAAAAGLSMLAASRLVQRRRRRRAVRTLLFAKKDGGGEEEPCLGLAVDVGSSSVRCTAYALRPGGRAVAVPGTMAQVLRDALDPGTGTADAGRVLADVEAVVDGCLGALRAEGLAHLVKVVGFAAFVMNLVGVDAEGAPVTPVLTYGDRHPHTGRYVALLRHRLQKEGKSGQGGDGEGGRVDPVYERTGAPAHAAYAAAQLWRLAAEEPETVARVHKWQTLVSLALARWMGQPFMPVSYSEASWTGLLDFRALEWCPPLLALLPQPFHPSTLPPLTDYDAGPPGALLTPAYARRWPELSHARFCLGVGDGACANLGSGCRDATRVAVTIGTSAAARVVADGSAAAAASLRVPPGLWCYRIDRTRLLLGGALTDGGSLVQWMARTLNIESLTTAEAQATLLPPGGGQGLAVLPFLSGERAPGWAPDATAAIAGVSRATGPYHLYRAGLESVALRLGRIVELLAVSGALAQEVVVGASGAALERSSLWRQIVADVLGMEVVLGRVSEATSLGAAVLMAEAVFGREGEGIEEIKVEGVETVVEAAARHVPDPVAHAAYREAMERQTALYEALYPR